MNLVCQNLQFTYSQNPAFRLSIPHLLCPLEKPIGIYGLTGSGKSTFGKILGGLLTPTDGGWHLDSADPIGTAAPRALYLPQFPEMIFLGMSIRNALETMLKKQPDSKGLALNFSANLKRLGLNYDQISERYGYELSAGELRLTTIALGLTMAPEMAIFDEPTIALSPAARTKFLNIIQESAGRKILIIISHDYRLIRKICANVLIFDRGKVVFAGEWEELQRHPEIIKLVGLDLLELIRQRKSGDD